MIKFKLTHPKRHRFGPKESETMSFQCVKKKKKIRAEEMQSGEEGEGEEEEEDGLTWSKHACVKGRHPGSGEDPNLRIACA